MCYNEAVRQRRDYKEKPKEAKPLTRNAKRLGVWKRIGKIKERLKKREEHLDRKPHEGDKLNLT